jgi:exosortase C (VPDSG-CTERM-specific)
MKNSPPGIVEVAAPLSPVAAPRRWGAFVIALVVVVLAFSLPLFNLVRFTLGSTLFSHIVLVPFVSAYLIWIQRGRIPVEYGRTTVLSVIAFGLGALTLLVSVMIHRSGNAIADQDHLAIQALAFVFFVLGTCGLFFRSSTLRAVMFPLAFLIFIVPIPVFMVNAIELFFQHTSAAAAAAFFKVAGTPFFRDQTFFQLPGINLEVAPECSGIRSSLALFITSLVAGQLFLHSRFNRVLLACIVVPLAIVRNGFRIFVIGALCVNVGPHMIDSPIHHQGGPIFFALSLIPFSIFLYLLVRSDSARKRRAASAATVPAPSADLPKSAGTI